jgi:hypothetical protein
MDRPSLQMTLSCSWVHVATHTKLAGSRPPLHRSYLALLSPLKGGRVWVPCLYPLRARRPPSILADARLVSPLKGRTRLGSMSLPTPGSQAHRPP